MDETQAPSDAAAATRKRRSSILKSQRPPRTPLSELEFNVATPTDTAKSRRVSFSRRTGVAEFVTNEATTTWKNFYEEHNKSLESSGNESAVHAHKPMSIGHIGKRIFDQQFEEVEFVDIVGNLRSNTLAQDFHTSLNNLNITQQLASLECYTNDRKLDPLIPNLELSSFTEKPTKIFGDELSIPVLPEMTNPIDINFSMSQPLSSNDKCDDLDEIVKDLKRAQPHIVCPGPLNGNKEISEYIEIDLNMTHIGIKNDDCDEMSITDTIRNPEVQEVSKSICSIHSEKKPTSDNDWIVDKENIAINPYITPKESKNFAQNNASDQILVFDGKKLSLKTESQTTSISDIKDNYRNILLPDLPTSATPKRKTIVLNINDDLPNFNSENLASLGKQEIDSITNRSEFKQNVMYNESDLSITQALSNRGQLSKSKTIVFEDNLGNISITQAVPAKVIINKEERRKTVIFENNAADISMTQGVSTKITGCNNSEKRKTIVYEEDISFTQALPPNLILNDKLKVSQNRTMYYENDGDISVTQVIPDNIISMVKDRYSESNLSDISITQDIPCNIINAEVKLVDISKAKTCDTQEYTNIEITQAVPDNLLLENKNRTGKRNTIVYENDYGDISITQAVPVNILCGNIDMNCDTKSKLPYIEEHISLIKPDISLPAKTELSDNAQEDHIKKISNRRNTIIYNDDLGDISMTHVIPSNIIMSLPETQKMDISSDHDVKDISITRALSTNILLRKSGNQGRDQLISPNPGVETNQNIVSFVNLNLSENNNILSRSIHEQSIKQNHVESLATKIITVTKPSSKYDIYKDNLEEMEIYTQQKNYESQTGNLMLTENLSMKQDILIYQAIEQKTSQSKVKHENYLKKEEADIGIETSNILVESNDKFSENKSDVILSKTSLDKPSSAKVNIIKQEKYFDDDSLLQKNSVVIKEGTLKTEMPVTKSLQLKKTFLNELLDMSNASLDDIAKNDICVTKSQDLPKRLTNNTDVNAKSSESLFVIIQDSEKDVHAENVQNNSNISEIKTNTISNDLVQNITKESLAFIRKEETEDVQDLHNKIAELKAVDENKKIAINRHYEKIISVDLHKDTEKFENSEIKGAIRRGKKSFKNADDTRELLGMLSDFTEGTDKNDKTIGPLEMKYDVAVDNKCGQNYSSLISKRNEALNKEIRRSISMAQAVLQQSIYNVDDESIEDTIGSPKIEESFEKDKEVIENERSRRKSGRMSTEVVKTLQFEEEDSISDISMKSDMKMSPLKKTAFGETSYIRENKAKVIPTYLKDVSDNIKALMSDLVKPMADVLPFDAVGLDRSLKKSSTCSTQIQANLITSSQIDMDVELHSQPESGNNIGTSQSILDIPTVANKKVTHAVATSIQQTSITASMEVDDIPVHEASNINRTLIHSSVKGPIIVFDHTNPLNNILLASTDKIKVHKYNPIKSMEMILGENVSPTQIEDKTNIENNFEVKRLSTHCDMENRLSQRQSGLQSGDAGVENIKDSHSLVSNISKPLSIDQSTEGLIVDVKNIEVNTVIAMKPNKELLGASSSLTLVDDALALSDFDLNLNAKSEEVCRPKSPLKVIYKMETEDDLLVKIDTDMVSKYKNNNENNDNSNPKKRSYSPTKRDDSRVINRSQDVTPVPVKKIQKMSNSPRHKRVIDDYLDELLLNSDKLESVSSLDKEAPTNKSKMTQQKPTKKKSPKRNEVIIQHVTTEYNRNNAEQKTDELETVKSSYESSDLLSTKGVKSMEIESSFTSSKDARETQDTVSVVSEATAKDAPILNWQPKLVDEESSKSAIESRSNFNVVDRINMLKCMGRECEWESSSGDVWTFRLLQSQIRLTARLAHTHYNASRSRVLADTPLETLAVDQIRKEVRDPLGVVCLRFATEAMRYECSQERCSHAADVTALLKRCAAIARVALCWAKVMRDSRLRLAYSITPEGDVSLKVANIPLRTVWEVTLRVDLVVGDAQEMAWPRAGRLRVHPVLADTRPAPDLTRLVSSLRKDWSHVPATIWKVFRYLKNKTTEDDPFL